MDIISKIVKRLPPQWYSSWLCEVDKALHELNQELSIELLHNFVSIKTRQFTNLSLETPRSNTKNRLLRKLPLSLQPPSIRRRITNPVSVTLFTF